MQTSSSFETVRFENKETVSVGRNGTIKTRGIEIYAANEVIDISPINSRGSVANGRISIPMDKKTLDATISELQRLRNTIS